MRWLINTAPTFGVTFGPDGNAADVGDVTVTITRGDGTTELVTDAATTNNGDGTYEYALAVANTTRVDRLRLDWTATTPGETLTTYEDLVGELIFTEAEARAYDDGEVGNATDLQIVEARDRITDLFELVTGISFGTRYARSRWRRPLSTNPYRLPASRASIVVGGPGAGYAPVSVISASDASGAVTLSEITPDPDGGFDRSTTWSSGYSPSVPWPIELEYAYGVEPIPADIRDAALRVARYELVVSDVTDRLVSFADPNVGTVRLSQPGRWSPTGIPVVDATLNRYRLPTGVGV